MRLKRINLNVQVTYRCNTVCQYCNRGIGVAAAKVPDMTAGRAKELVDALGKAGMRINRTKIGGGEPILNSELLDIVSVFRSCSRYVWVLTNGLGPLPRLPDGASWIRNHVDDKFHEPFYVSPTDVGVTSFIVSQDKPCVSVKVCGRGLDANGFMQCPVASTLGRALGKVVHSDQPIMKQDMDLCRHCTYALSQEDASLVWQKVYDGETEYPSKSFAAVKIPKPAIIPAGDLVRAKR